MPWAASSAIGTEWQLAGPPHSWVVLAASLLLGAGRQHLKRVTLDSERGSVRTLCAAMPVRQPPFSEAPINPWDSTR